MYCKQCGKQIADNSKYCQFCGSEQEEKTTIQEDTNSEMKKIIEIPSIKTNISEKGKKWLYIYLTWFLLNFVFIFVKKYDYSSRCFWPFQKDWGNSPWDLKYYDFSEFLVYAILIPMVVFGYYKYKEKKKESTSNSKK
jgi:hypothetical protein